MKELVIGSGSKIKKCLFIDKNSEFINPVTLDINPNHNPDVVWDLNNHPLPFNTNEFNEIHAYDVLEHLSSQGNYKFFFNEFSEYARILKPGGLFMGTVPSPKSVWVWGDPSHTRLFHPCSLQFLNQDFYKDVGKTQMSDFRYIYKANFVLVFAKETDDKFYFILEVKK